MVAILPELQREDLVVANQKKGKATRSVQNECLVTNDKAKADVLHGVYF